VLPDLPLALPGIPLALPDAPRLVAGSARGSHKHPKFCPVRRGVCKPTTITPMVLVYLDFQIPDTLKTGRNDLRQSDSLQNLIHLSIQ
jgi:hypothetical protein